MKNIVLGALALALMSVAPAIAQDVKAGKRVYKSCKACHSDKPGKHKNGPSLHNVVGSMAGQAEGYEYSEAMASSGLTWDVETLSNFIRNPKEIVPDTKMAYGGLSDEQKLTDLIAYLETLKDE